MSVSIPKAATGAWLLRYALEHLPVKFTFGIPGLQNTEIYDELNKSEKITPVLVTHEGGASFMADGVSRTSEGVGTLLIVPAAGVTHAMSGIAEAFLDGVPMLIISGGIRRDSGMHYQLHQWDQHSVLAETTKATFLIKKHREIVPTVFEAFRIAVEGEPGPVFIEIPVNIQLFKGEVGELPNYVPAGTADLPKIKLIEQAVELLLQGEKPGLFVGWGCRNCTKELVELAETLNAPVATTLQGLSVFPADHPLHTGMGFGASAVPAAENAFRDCDVLLAVGVRFAEIPTGSFGVRVPDDLIHIDINPKVFDKNYPARIALAGDAGLILEKMNRLLQTRQFPPKNPGLADKIANDKAAYRDEWMGLKTDRVNPALFFGELRTQLEDDAYMVVDDGNHTFLAAELFPVFRSGHFISPTDFNCMGYCIPAAIGVKLANPGKQVVGIVGDGAFLMTCMEILTAAINNLGVIYFVFHDGELSQISQGQEIPYNRKTCSILGTIDIGGVAKATGAAFLTMNRQDEIAPIISESLKISENGQPVIVDVAVDYSKRTRFTKGVVETVLKRFPVGDKFRFVGRALLRKVTG